MSSQTIFAEPERTISATVDYYDGNRTPEGTLSRIRRVVGLFTQAPAWLCSCSVCSFTYTSAGPRRSTRARKPKIQHQDMVDLRELSTHELCGVESPPTKKRKHQNNSATEDAPRYTQSDDEDDLTWDDLPTERQDQVKRFLKTRKTIKDKTREMQQIQDQMTDPLNMPQGSHMDLEKRIWQEKYDIEATELKHAEAARKAEKEKNEYIARIRATAQVEKAALEKKAAEDEKNWKDDMVAKHNAAKSDVDDATREWRELKKTGGYDLGEDVGRYRRR
jgi:hypothetical protein